MPTKHEARTLNEFSGEVSRRREPHQIKLAPHVYLDVMAPSTDAQVKALQHEVKTYKTANGVPLHVARLGSLVKMEASPCTL